MSYSSIEEAKKEFLEYILESLKILSHVEGELNNYLKENLDVLKDYISMEQIIY